LHVALDFFLIPSVGNFASSQSLTLYQFDRETERLQ